MREGWGVRMKLTDQEREYLREKINNDILGHDGKDGTYIYVLTRVKEAFGYGTMTLDDFVEVDEDFTEELLSVFERFLEHKGADMLETRS